MEERKALTVTQLANLPWIGYHGWEAIVPHESALRYSLSCTHFDTHDQWSMTRQYSVGVTLMIRP